MSTDPYDHMVQPTMTRGGGAAVMSEPAMDVECAPMTLQTYILQVLISITNFKYMSIHIRLVPFVCGTNSISNILY